MSQQVHLSELLILLSLFTYFGKISDYITNTLQIIG